MITPSQQRWLDQIVKAVVHDVIIQETFGGDVNEARRFLGDEQNFNQIVQHIVDRALPILNEDNRTRRRDLLADLMKVLENDPEARMKLAQLVGGAPRR